MTNFPKYWAQLTSNTEMASLQTHINEVINTRHFISKSISEEQICTAPKNMALRNVMRSRSRVESSSSCAGRYIHPELEKDAIKTDKS